MEVLPTPAPPGPSGEQGLSGPLSGEPGPSGPDDELLRRLARIEDRLDVLGERLGRMETSTRVAVAEEVQAATSELRRVISELGRRLVQDLPHELRRHRDAIVAELRPPPPPPPPPEPELAEDPPPADVPEDVLAGLPDPPEPPEVAEQRRASRRRRRHG